METDKRHMELKVFLDANKAAKERMMKKMKKPAASGLFLDSAVFKPGASKEEDISSKKKKAVA